MTSSPIKPVNFEDAGIWCGNESGGGGGGGGGGGSKIRTIRQTVEQQLQQCATNGDTDKLIKLLEDGAPFVIDMVNY